MSTSSIGSCSIGLDLLRIQDVEQDQFVARKRSGSTVLITVSGCS